MHVLARLTADNTAFIVVGLLWSAYQGLRGATETRLNNAKSVGYWKPWERWVVLYVHDFAFRFVCTAAGFLALFAAHLALEGEPDTGSLAFAGLAFLVGIVGVGGQLHYVILLGKVPGVR